MALHLGFYDVDQMIAGTNPNLIKEWIEYAEIEPFGEERADLRNAILCCITANAYSGKGKRFSVKDFMPKFNTKKARNIKNPQHAEQVLRALIR